MTESVLLLCQALSLSLIAAWLFTGVRDNIRYPRLNEEFTADDPRLDSITPISQPHTSTAFVSQATGQHMVALSVPVKKDGREIHNRGHETFLFRRTADGWKVVHTHSSTRPVR